MRIGVSRRSLAVWGAIGAALIVTGPADAQYSDTYNFLNGVRQRDYADITAAVEAPGSTVINARDRTTGEGALHMVTRRRDTQLLLYLLQHNANPNLRDNQGNTAMHLAAQIGYGEGIRWLGVVNADVNAPNNRGETPLILAVQQRNADTVQQLIDLGADPDITDGVVGRSARDYAARDQRAGAIREILDNARPVESVEAIGPVLD